MFNRRRWLFVVLALMTMVSLALAGCAGNENGALNNGVPDNGPGAEDPLVEPDEGTPADPDEAPLDEPTEAATPIPEVEPAEEATPTLEPTATLEAIPTEVPAAGTPADEGDEVGGFGGAWALSSRLIGLTVESETGEEIADIDEILFAEDGELRYAIFDVDTYLDLDEDRTIAVAWDMVEVRAPDSDTMTDTQAATSDRPVVVYTGSDEQLREAPGIDRDGFDDQPLMVDPAQFGLDVQEGRLFRLADLTDPGLFDQYDVVNEQGEDLGDIEDLVVNLEEGAVRYVIIGVGGFLGIGEKNVAIPMEQVTYNEQEQTLVIPVTEEDLEATPGIDYGILDSDGFDLGWNEENDAYWDETLPETGLAAAGTTDGATVEDTDTTIETTQVARWALVSELLNTSVRLEGGEIVSDIDNLLVDLNGEIRYVILQIGDDLDDIDERTVAVDYEMFRPTMPTTLTNDTRAVGAGDADETGDTTTDVRRDAVRATPVLVYTGSREDLAAAQEIDTNLLRDRDVITDAATLGLDAQADARLLQTANLRYDLVNEDGTRISNIEDLVIDMQEGTVRYLVIGVGGFLGIGQDYIAIPWDMVRYDEQNDNLVVPISSEDEEALDDAPIVNLRLFRSEGFTPDWSNEVDSYWGETLPETGPGVVDQGETQRWALLSELLDMTVSTQDGEDIAPVRNILFNTDGVLRYVIFNVDDYLGDLDEDRTVAVEWDRFEVMTPTTETINAETDKETDTAPTQDTQDAAPMLVYRGTEDELRQAPAFDTDVLGSRRVFTGTAALGLNTATDDRLLQADDLNYVVVNADGNRINDVDDLILDLQEGVVRYLAIGVGGFLGIGQKYVAVPMDMVSYDETKNNLVMAVSEADGEVIRDAPTVDLNQFRNEGLSPGWNESSDSYWGETLPETGAARAEVHQWVLTTELLNTTVRTQDGEQIAPVRNILFNIDGELRYVVFDVHNYFDDLEDYLTVAVAWERFEIMTPTMEIRDLETAPGANPGVAPDADPGTAPGTGPGTVPGAEPGIAPGAAQDVQATRDAWARRPVLVYTGTADELRQEMAIDTDVLGDRRVFTDTTALGLDDAIDQRLLQADDLGYDIVNEDGEDIGRIYDLVLHQDQNTINYLVVGVGGFLGIGRTYVAVPWEMVDYDETENALVLPISEGDAEAFGDAPTINLRGFRNVGFSPSWNLLSDTYWENFRIAGPM